jgi:hypothetical protein
MVFIDAYSEVVLNMFLLRKFGGRIFFSHLLKDLNPSGELSSQWTYHCSMRPFAVLNMLCMSCNTLYCELQNISNRYLRSIPCSNQGVRSNVSQRLLCEGEIII